MDSDCNIPMDREDFIRMKDAEIRSLQEELACERVRRASAEREADESYKQMMSITRSYARLRQQVDSWTREADEQAAMQQQLERQGYEE